MKTILSILILVILLALTGCMPPDSDSSVHHNRGYSVDCGNAQQVGSGSCGMTITDVFIGIGGGGQ